MSSDNPRYSNRLDDYILHENVISNTRPLEFANPSSPGAFMPFAFPQSDGGPWSLPRQSTPLTTNSDITTNTPTFNHSVQFRGQIMKNGHSGIYSQDQSNITPISRDAQHTPGSLNIATPPHGFFDEFDGCDDSLLFGIPKNRIASDDETPFPSLTDIGLSNVTDDLMPGGNIVRNRTSSELELDECFKLPSCYLSGSSIDPEVLALPLPDEWQLPKYPVNGRQSSVAETHGGADRSGRISSVETPPQATQGNKRKRRRFGSQERKGVNEVRIQGACLRCQKLKEKCDLDVPCQNCRKVLATATIYKQPCRKVPLKAVVPFRAGNSRAGETRSSFPKLIWLFDEPQLRTTEISQDFINPARRPVPSMTVVCRRFAPGLRDILTEPYEAPDGEVRMIKSPPFASFDIDTPKSHKAMEKYLDECQPFAEDDMMVTISDDITRLGITEARRYVKTREKSIVSLALKIQACVHSAAKQPIIVGPDTLDVKPVEDVKFDIHGKFPAPSVLDYQLDTLLIQYMQKKIKVVTGSLKKLIKGKNNTANWYEIFLTVFVLLSTLEHVYSVQNSYLRRHTNGDKQIYTKIDFVSRSMIDEWKASAKILIYHFRYDGKAMLPFSLPWTPDQQKQAELDPESLAYITKMVQVLEIRKSELQELRKEDLDNEHAKPLVWLKELFLDD